MQREWERSLDGLLAHWVTVTRDQRQQIVDQVEAAINRDDLLALTTLAPSTADAETLLLVALNDMAMVAAQQVVDDAANEGTNLDAKPGRQRDRRQLAAVVAAILADAMATAAAREAIRHASPGVPGRQVANAVDEHLSSLSDAFLRDNLGGALTAAQNQGRFATMSAGPEVALYASEMMDARTCGPCQQVNGKWLGNSSDMAQVYASYPNGGYVGCLGGARCRGTVVAIYRPDTVDEGSGQ